MLTLDQWVGATLGCPSPLTSKVLEQAQLQKLNETLALARASSSFYAPRLPEEPLSSLAELEELPFTTPQDLKEQGRQMLCVKPDAIARIVTLSTSGSTGAPKRVYFTREDQERTIDFFHHGMATLISPGGTVLLLFPGESPGSLNDLLVRALRRMDCTGVPFGFPTPERYGELIRAMEEHAVSCLIGTARSIAGAAEWSRQAGRAGAAAAHLECVLLAADFVSQMACDCIQAAWGCTVHEHYGSTESGLGGAVSCAAHQGYHTQACDLYFEIIHPETLRPVPPGGWGEVVLTTLSRRGMPLIRYRTGDVSRLLPDPCPCGSILPRLDRVQSRPQRKKFDRPGNISF